MRPIKSIIRISMLLGFCMALIPMGVAQMPKNPDNWSTNYINAACSVNTRVGLEGTEEFWKIRMGYPAMTDEVFIFSAAANFINGSKIPDSSKAMIVLDSRFNMPALSIKIVNDEIIVIVKNTKEFQLALKASKQVDVILRNTMKKSDSNILGFQLENISGALSWLNKCALSYKKTQTNDSVINKNRTLGSGMMLDDKEIKEAKLRKDCKNVSGLSQGTYEFLAKRLKTSINSIDLIRSEYLGGGCNVKIDTPRGPITCFNVEVRSEGGDAWAHVNSVIAACY